jgi:hypothetical protein
MDRLRLLDGLRRVLQLGPRITAGRAIRRAAAAPILTCISFPFVRTYYVTNTGSKPIPPYCGWRHLRYLWAAREAFRHRWPERRATSPVG